MAGEVTKRASAKLIRAGETLLASGEKVNVIGVCVSSPSGVPYPQFVLDDGSGQMLVRLFNQSIPEGVRVGSSVLVIGKVREDGIHKYLSPEIVKPVDSRWLKVRHGLFENTGRINIVEQHLQENPIVSEEMMSSESPKRTSSRILTVMREEDRGNGVSAEDLFLRIQEHGAEEVVAKLIKEGEIFEVTPGRYKVLE